MAPRAPFELTARQAQAIVLAASGLSYVQIGEVMGIKASTVEEHLRLGRRRGATRDRLMRAERGEDTAAEESERVARAFGDSGAGMKT